MSINGQGAPGAASSVFSKAERDAVIAAVAGHLDAGRFGEAAKGCGLILATDAADAEALCFLGMARCGSGDTAAGLEVFARAFAVAETAGMRTNYGTTLNKLGRLAEAHVNHQRAVELDPWSAAAWNNLGVSLAALERFEEAVEAYRRAVTIEPAYVEAWNNLGARLLQLDRKAEALDAFEAGVAAGGDGASVAQASALLGLGRLAEAARVARSLAAQRPQDPAALAMLGRVLRELDRDAEAEAVFRRLVALQPGDGWAYNALAIALRHQGRLVEAGAVLDLALALDPVNADAWMNRALVHLLLGDLVAGWACYDWRFRIDEGRGVYAAFAERPKWRGEPIEGKTIWIASEQGLGDVIQFVRYLPLVAARGARVVLSVLDPLARLLNGFPGVAQAVGEGRPLPPHDVFCPLLSLPRAFGTSLDTIPAAIPYLRAEPALRPKWRARIGTDRAAGLRVGLVWAGNPIHKGDRHRSLAFETLSPLWDIAGIRWFSLQVGPRAADLDRAPPGLVDDIAADFSDFTETAAAIEALDLVVAVDTAVAHLAGALGKTIWMLLALACDWRWTEAGERTPWYPTMRLFRQPRQGAWGPVVTAVATALAQRAAAACPASRNR